MTSLKDKKIAISDMFAIEGLPMTAGSKILAGFMPPYESAVAKKLKDAGAELIQFSHGEFGLGTPNDIPADAAIVLDNSGQARRGKTMLGFKPTYGLVSRHGAVQYASSMDAPAIMANTAAEIESIFRAITGPANLEPKSQNLDPAPLNFDLTDSKLAHEIISASEAASNLACFDGARFGFRAEADNLEDMYSKTRAEGFGEKLQKIMIIGTAATMAENIDAWYFQAAKIRRKIANAFAEAFKSADLLVIQTDEDSLVAANLAGLPALSLPDGRQIVGQRFDDFSVLAAAKKVGK